MISQKDKENEELQRSIEEDERFVDGSQDLATRGRARSKIESTAD